MTDEKNPIDQALDVFVYAPIGLALSLRDELPKLAERGRQRVNGQVTMARMVGQFAAQQGQREAEKLVRQAGERATEILGDVLGAKPAPPPASRPAERAAAHAEAAARAEAMEAKVGENEVAPARPVPDADDLAIPGYDTLSASQVVQRLAGLTAEERQAVEDYERANRSRRTILNRIEQLQKA